MTNKPDFEPLSQKQTAVLVVALGAVSGLLLGILYGAAHLYYKLF